MTRTAAPRARRTSQAPKAQPAPQPVEEVTPAPVPAPQPVKAPKETKRQKVARMAGEAGYKLVNHYRSELWTVENADGTALLFNSETGEATDKAEWIAASKKNATEKQ